MQYTPNPAISAIYETTEFFKLDFDNVIDIVYALSRQLIIQNDLYGSDGHLVFKRLNTSFESLLKRDFEMRSVMRNVMRGPHIQNILNGLFNSFQGMQRLSPYNLKATYVAVKCSRG
jgi:hypothetical protein